MHGAGAEFKAVLQAEGAAQVLPGDPLASMLGAARIERYIPIMPISVGIGLAQLQAPVSQPDLMDPFS
jgi:hypothetical protein